MYTFKGIATFSFGSVKTTANSSSQNQDIMNVRRQTGSEVLRNSRTLTNPGLPAHFVAGNEVRDGHGQGASRKNTALYLASTVCGLLIANASGDGPFSVGAQKIRDRKKTKQKKHPSLFA